MRHARLALAALFALLAVGSASAQEARPDSALVGRARNAVYVELIGNGLLYSVNYDRMLTDHLSARVGASYLGARTDTESASLATFPVMINYLTGARSNHHFEAGAGVTLLTASAEDLDDFEEAGFDGIAGTATLGYRYQRPQGGFVFRSGLTPFFGAGGVLVSAGVSLGYSF
jgi:hypothetical protein